MTDLFDYRLLDRYILSDAEASTFRAEAKKCVRYDEATGTKIVCYLHPDGRVFIDSIILPNYLARHA